MLSAKFSAKEIANAKKIITFGEEILIWGQIYDIIFKLRI